MFEATIEKVGVAVRDALLTMFIVVVAWLNPNEAELSPPRFRVIGKLLTAKVFRLQKDTHRLVLLISNYICSKLISWFTQKSEGITWVVLYS